MLAIEIKPNKKNMEFYKALFKADYAFGAGYIRNPDKPKKVYNPATGGIKTEYRNTVQQVGLYQEAGIPGVPYRSVINAIYRDPKHIDQVRQIIEKGFKRGGRTFNINDIVKSVDDAGDYLRRKMKARFRQNKWARLSPKTRPKAKTRDPMLFSSQLRRTLGSVRIENGKRYGKEIGRMRVRMTKMNWPPEYWELYRKFKSGNL